MIASFFGWGFLVQTQRMDQKLNPAEERSFESPNNAFQLRVVTLDHWKTREPIAIFSKLGKEIWRAKLPHSHGPRFTVVTDSGVSVLFDEWINIESSHAVTIVPQSGPSKQRVWTFAQIQSALGVDVGPLSRAAKLGPWMSQGPVLKGNVVEVLAGGKILVVDTKESELRTRK